MADFVLDTEQDKKELADKIKYRLKNFKGWLADFQEFFGHYKLAKGNPLSRIHDKLPDVKRIEYIPQAAVILNYRYWNVVNNYLRLTLMSNGKVDESKVINRYKAISATELTIMMIRPIVYTEGEKADEVERFLNALFAWYVAMFQIHTWESEDTKSDASINMKTSADNIIKISSLYEPALRNEGYAISFRDEHLRWLAFVETDSYVPVLSNAQTWRMFYFCLQALNNGLSNFTATTGLNPKPIAYEDRRNTSSSRVRNTTGKVSRK